jgi:hypothetical protein
LRQSVPQTLEILDTIKAGEITERVSPLFVTNTEAGAEALAHMRGVATGYGFDIAREPISERYLAGYRFANAIRVLRRPITAALPLWLERSGVLTFPEGRLTLLPKKDKSFAVRAGEDRFGARQVVFMDDAAIDAHLPARDLGTLFHRIAHASVMLEPLRGGTKSIVSDVDRGLTIHQRPSGALDCIGPGSVEEICRLASTYGASGRVVRLAGHALFERLITKDGAPVYGALRAGAPQIMGGLGPTGLFQVPALARYLTDSCAPWEADYFAARKPSGRGVRRTVFDFQTVADSGTSAKAKVS